MTNTQGEPPAIRQKSTEHDDREDVPDCPFCTIGVTYPPINPTDLGNPQWDPERLSPPGFVLLSTDNVIAFLDIAPLTRGHVLVAPRRHRIKIGDLKSQEMAQIGSLMPMIARSVMQSVMPDIHHDEVDYNIVQNNGPGAAQVIPHVHFHIIPRPPLNYRPPSPGHTEPIRPNGHINQRPPFPPGTEPLSNNKSHRKPKHKPKPKSQYPPSSLPTGVQASYIQFGRGRRTELDEEEAAELVVTMRANIRDEWRREFPSVSSLQMSSSTDQTTTSEDDKLSSSPQQHDEVIKQFTNNIETTAGIEGSSGLVTNLHRRGVLTNNPSKSHNREGIGKL